MKRQTILWTSLPNGAAGGTLRLSVLASPRLWNDASSASMKLQNFPDFLDWPARINAATFQVVFEGGPTLPAARVSPDASLEVWQALFKETTLVKPFVFEDLTGVEVVSFPADVIHDALKGVYQRVATDPALGGGKDLPGIDALAGDPAITAIAHITEDQHIEQPTGPDHPVDMGGTPEGKQGGGGCCLFWFYGVVKALLKRLGIIATLPTALAMTSPPAAPAAPAGAPAVNATQAAFDQLKEYVAPLPPAAQPIEDLVVPESDYDFHAMISSAGDYPVLLRQLGLVVDLEVTLGANQPLPVSLVQVQPTVALTTLTTHHTPRTHYELNLAGGRFLAQPRAGSEINAGLLRFEDATRFQVIQTDVAGSGVKLQNLATNLCAATPRPVNGPKEEGLPALQTAGISVIRPALPARLVEIFQQSYALNAALAAREAVPVALPLGGSAPPATDELYAEDVNRGYRVDVFDDKSNRWHSLCQRKGHYAFLDGPPGLALDLDDEGFVQIAASEPLSAPAGTRQLRASPALFTWDGWSLCAPRPYKTIKDDAPDMVEDVHNTAATPFRMEVEFKARPGSLPRLRFGYSYRLRARLVDLAGNSVFNPGNPAFALDPPEATPPFKFTRFEPVSPPAMLLRTAPKEGESLETLVVRSAYDSLSAAPGDNDTERHIVPPKISQAMAELHGCFDQAGGMLNGPDGYGLAAREAGTLKERFNQVSGNLEIIPGVSEVASGDHTVWLQANEIHEVTYLPDPHARGVLLLGLPGMAAFDQIIEPDGTVVNKIPFEDAWPDLQPFRLRLTGILAGQAPAQPAWNTGKHVLEVQLPQGQTADVRICCYFEAADLVNQGVWEWTREAAPPNLADLETLAVAGRSWLHLPFRQLLLVHAVSRPLTIPQIADLKSPQTPGPNPDYTRNLGDTSAPLSGELHVDAKSTGRVDLSAEWQDPFDDPAKAAYDSTTDVINKSMAVASLEVTKPVLPLVPAGSEVMTIDNLQHAIGDTKYHHVTYRATATTRFREFFAPADPADLIRPTAAEAGTPAANPAHRDVDIPNVARPQSPRLLYVIPTFEWLEHISAPNKIRQRKSGGLRVYMERPWFSSGAGELLAAVVKRAGVLPTSPADEALRSYASEWGLDPIWPAASTAPLQVEDFSGAAAVGRDLELEEIPGTLMNAAGYPAGYDGQRNLWYSDIVLLPGRLYYPFVRLALARYQPISRRGAHLSRVVQADFIQLVPDRTVTYNLQHTSPGGMLPIRMHGPAYHFAQIERVGSPVVYAVLQRREIAHTTDELGWESLPDSLIKLDAVQQDVTDTIWEGVMKIPDPAPYPLRLVVVEYEVFLSTASIVQPTAREVEGRASVPGFSRFGMVDPGLIYPARMVFADAIEIAS